MIYRIVQYIQPWEIDDFERQLHHILPSTYYIEPHHKLIWDVTMNLDIVDWSSSKMPKQYYENRFKYLEKIANYNLTAEFDTNSTIRGCTDKRRSVSNKEHDYVIWLDSDIFSTSNLIPSLIVATSHIRSSTFILTPEIVKFWDASWDVITAKQFLHESYEFRNDFDAYSLNMYESSELGIRKNDSGVKLAGGWANLFTRDIFEKIPIPEEIGPYGPDDTYLMMCAQYLNIPQYIIEGVLVTDIPHITHKYSRNEYKKEYLSITIGDRDRISLEQLNEIVATFYKANSNID